MSSKNTPANQQTVSQQKDAAEPVLNDKGKKPSDSAGSKPHLGALEEDDEFEDFVAQDWNEKDDKDPNLWEDNWDDDDIDDDFSAQLRAEFDKAQPMKL